MGSASGLPLDELDELELERELELALELLVETYSVAPSPPQPTAKTAQVLRARSKPGRAFIGDS